MALLEGDEQSEMPSMSWNSVVKGGTGAKGGPPSGNADAEADDRGDPSSPPVSFSTPTLTSAAPAIAPVMPATPASPPPPPPPPPVAPVPASATLSVPAFDDLLDQTSQPVLPAGPAPAPLPDIIEATPPSSDTSQIAAVVAEPVLTAPVVEPAATQAPALSEPSVPAPPVPSVAPAAQANPALLLPPTAAATRSAADRGVAPVNEKPRKQRKDRSRSVARVGVFFLVVGALASAAVIFGRPYLFPADWEANALEFAEPIEVARGAEFEEPVLLTAQPTEVHREMVAAQLLGDPASNLAMWRALGLAGPDSTDDATLDALISEQSPVLYSTVDGQVYFDAAFTRSDRAALISRAMATAALDQEFAFSSDVPNRTLDDAALTEANVRQQAALIAQTAATQAPLPTADMAALAFLPSVLDYRLTAPSVFVDLLPPVNDVASNPLAELGIQGPGPLRVAPLAQIPSNSLVVGDSVVGSSISTDRSFWYLSFASHVDATTAYRMSNQLRSAGLQMVDGSTGRCAVATFATADAATNATLRLDLDTWVAATAPELGASVSALPDSNVQLRSCDPAGVYNSNIRFGVARELMGWRAVELQVTNLVVAQGGTDSDIAAAIARVGSTPTAVAVAQLPAGTSPADLAAAAQVAASDVIVAVANPALPVDPLAADPAVAGE